MKTFIKDPSAKKDYDIDWSRELASGDAIDSSTWAIKGPDDSLVKVTSSVAGKVATVWLEGGTVHETYVVTNSLTTTSGRKDDRSFRITIQER